jgi:hypothetical protein
MKWCVPIYPTFDVPDAAQAEQLRTKFEQVLNQPHIKMLLMSQGIPGIVGAITLGPPYPVDERALAAQVPVQAPVPRRR